MTFCSRGREVEPAGLSAVLLLLALIPCVSAIQVNRNESYVSVPSNCQPSVQNQYPVNATVGQEIVIITTVSSGCVGPDVVISQVIVNILPPESSEILSTAPASPVAAVNMITAPTAAGPWSLVVQVFWNGNPTSGNFELFQTTITILIIH